jgi:hypothetical protein
VKAPTATFSCEIDYAPYVFDHLRRGGFSVSYHESSAPAVFDYVVSDGVRRSALTAVKHPKKKDITLMLAPMRPRRTFRGLFGQKKFDFAVVTWLLNASWGDPDNGLQGGGVVARLKPPPLTLVGSIARAFPPTDDDKGA